MSTATLRRTIIGVSIALAVTACGGNTIEGAASGASDAPTLPSAQSEEEANASADAEASASSSAAGPSTNQRGNIVKTLGEEGGLTSEEGKTFYTFAIDSITPDIPCTEEYTTSDPENGHLTAVQMRLSTQAFTPDELSYLTVSSSDFTFIGSDGLTFTNVDTIATYGCLSGSVKFPSDQLNPGSQYAGVVLLDLPQTAGTLVYKPSSVYGTGGWEISF